MHTRRLLSLVPLGLALATVDASRAEAQRRTAVTVCRDGSQFDTDALRVCDRHRGVDDRATESARRALADRVADGRGVDRRGNRQDDDPRYDDRNDHGGYHNGNNGNNGNNGDNGNNGRYGVGRNVVYEWQGTVDKEIQIQLHGNRAVVQPIGASEPRNDRGRIVNGLPQQDGTLIVERLQGRGDVDVIVQPTSRNGYTATLRVRDSRGGADNYRIVAYWQPSSNGNGRWGDNGRYGRN